MSCHEWEKGTITIPSNQWGKFRKTIIQAYNEQQKYKEDHLPISKSCTIYEPNAEVTLDNDTKTIKWYVPENNHAREHAEASWLGRVVFGALNRIEWPSRGKTGGVLVGNDEYNREASYVGGGGNYVTATYGPLGKKYKDQPRGW